MKLDTTFLRSKLARRIFWLFVLCALLPITVFALLSLRNVTLQLTEQSRRQLRQSGHEEGQSILERLNFLEADMKLMASDIRGSSGADPSSVAAGLSSNLKGRIGGLELITVEGERRLLFGKIDAEIDPDSNERSHMRSGKTWLTTRACGEFNPCVFLSRDLGGEYSGQKILVAEIQAGYLWDAETIPETVDLCVFDDQGSMLFCSGEAPEALPAKIKSFASGQFEWKQGKREYLADFWRLYLKPTFFVPQWTIVASEANEDILSPLVTFKRSFSLAFLLALWFVLLLSLAQIRRNLVPLGELQDGTRRIAAGDFHSQVTVKSNDEFAELAASFNSMAGRIERQIGSLKTINEIDRAILSSWDIEQIVDDLMVRLPSLLPCDFASVSLLDPHMPRHAVTYLSAASLQQPREIKTATFTDEEFQTLNTRTEIQSFQLYSDHPQHLLLLALHGVTSFLVVPIFLKGCVSAIITLGHTKTFAWTAEDKQQVRQVADQMAVAISNARLLAEHRELHWGTLTALARAIDAKSPWTSGHSERVTKLALRIATTMGLSQNELDIIHRGGLLHDIGKIGTPVAILDKPGKLTPEEMEQMRDHVRVGARILEPIPAFAECLPIVMQHHEWVNGSGYPQGLAGAEISLHARIFAVADCYDALISDRPYRPGMPLERVIGMIREGTGKQFDPLVVDAFLNLMKAENSAKRVEWSSPVLVERK